MKSLLCLVAGLFLFSGCQAIQPRIPGSGMVNTEHRPVAAFNEIELSGFGTVNVIAGQYPSVHVTTDDNLLGWVETEVANGKLKIKPTRNIKPKTGLVVDVTMPELVAAHISGAGELNVDGIYSDSLDLSISGAGDMTARGQVRHISTKISGAGSADFKELVANSADVTISGAGSVDVYATESVDAKVSGAGSVVCHGRPADVKQRVSGIGSVKLR